MHALTVTEAGLWAGELCMSALNFEISPWPNPPHSVSAKSGRRTEGRKISFPSQGPQCPKPPNPQVTGCMPRASQSHRMGLPPFPLAPLQSVLLATAREILSTCKSDHVTPHLSSSMGPHCSWNQHKNLLNELQGRVTCPTPCSESLPPAV